MQIERPAFAQLQAAVFAREVSTVVVFKLDRLSRSLRDGINTLCEWCDKGLRIANLTVDKCTFNSNTAANNGGAFYNLGGGIASVSNSTFFNNTVTATGFGAGKSGGAIKNFGTLSLTDDTINHNTVPSGGNGVGAGISNNGTVTMNNSIVVGNSNASDLA